MTGRYLLDTNVVISLLKDELDLGPHRDRRLEIFLCLTVLGELFFGAEKSNRAEENRSRIERLLELCPILPYDLETARHYARTKAALKRRGRPIPENDLWIAASALQHGACLVTRDRHFDEVEGLQLERW